MGSTRGGFAEEFRRELEEFKKLVAEKNAEVENVEMEKVGEFNPSKPRGDVLAQAMNVINGERQDVYGSPEDSFRLIGEYWGIFLKSIGLDKVNDPTDVESEVLIIAPEHVAMMMTLFKIARESNQHKRDNIIDAAGYLGIYADMQSSED